MRLWCAVRGIPVSNRDYMIAGPVLAKLREKYPGLGVLADEIHNSRMMSPPACEQCLQIAFERLNARVTTKRTCELCGLVMGDWFTEESCPRCDGALIPKPYVQP